MRLSALCGVYLLKELSHEGIRAECQPAGMAAMGIQGMNDAHAGMGGFGFGFHI